MSLHRVRLMIFMASCAMFAAPTLCHGFDFPPGGDGPPPVPPFIAEQYDANGDGVLSPDEMDAAHKAFMERFDTDSDGVLSMSERHAVHEAGRQAFLNAYDTDGDGEISQEEHEEAQADFIARFDADGDGTLSKEELKAAGPPHRGGPGHGRKGFPQEVSPQ